MKALGLLIVVSLFSFSSYGAIGVYYDGHQTFSYTRGSSSYVSARSDRWIESGCCAGGLSGYFGGGRFHAGWACASTESSARRAAADACLSRNPSMRCDWSMTSNCSY